MTYKLNPVLGLIVSPVILHLPNGEEKSYRDGQEMIRSIFDVKYKVEEIRAVEGTVVIRLTMAEMPDVSFFD